MGSLTPNSPVAESVDTNRGNTTDSPLTAVLPPPRSAESSPTTLTTDSLAQLLNAPAYVFGNSSRYENNRNYLPNPDMLNQAICQLARLRGQEVNIQVPQGEYDPALLSVARSLLGLDYQHLQSLSGAEVHQVVAALQNELRSRGLTVEQLEPVTSVPANQTGTSTNTGIVSPSVVDLGNQPTPATDQTPGSVNLNPVNSPLPPLGNPNLYLPSTDPTQSGSQQLSTAMGQRFGQMTEVIRGFDRLGYSRNPWGNPTFNLDSLTFSGNTDCMSHQYMLLAIGANLASDNPRSLSAEFLRDWGYRVVGENMRMSPGNSINTINYMERAFYQYLGEARFSNGRLTGGPFNSPSIDIMQYPPGTYVGLGTGRDNIVHGVTILGYVDSSGARWRWNQQGSLQSNRGDILAPGEVQGVNFVDFEVLNVSTSNTRAENQVFISTLSEEIQGTMRYSGSSNNRANFYLPNYYRLPPGTGSINSPTALHNRNPNLVAFNGI